MMLSAYERAVDILTHLVAFNTTSQLSNLACVEWIEDYLKSHDIHCTRLYNKEGSKASLIASIGPRKEGGIVFSGHTDVVPVEQQQWNTNPFELVEQNDRFFGRGTADMKGFLACVLAQVPVFQGLSERLPIHFAFSYDEEVGCLAAPELSSYLAGQTWRPQLVVVGEPTSMQVIDAHKGCYSFITTIKGRTGHSSKPQLGANAVMAAAELIHTLNQMALELTRPENSNPRFEPPYSTVHVGMLHGGTARNIIPDYCEFAWEIRPIPGQDVSHLLERFATRSDEVMHLMQLAAPEADISTEKLSFNSGLRPLSGQESIHAVMLAARTNVTQAVSYATEASFFQNEGFTTLVCGPGNIDQAHKADEFVEAAQLKECLKFIEALVKEFPAP